MTGHLALLLLFLVGAFSSLPLRAVDTLQVASPDPFQESYRWATFDRASGLAGNPLSVFEDREGDVWFVTDQGVQRYDGLYWTTYTTDEGLADNVVFEIEQVKYRFIEFVKQIRQFVERRALAAEQLSPAVTGVS